MSQLLRRIHTRSEPPLRDALWGYDGRDKPHLHRPGNQAQNKIHNLAHERPMRGKTFVTRKIACAVAAIAHGRQARLYLGNLDANPDWGHA